MSIKNKCIQFFTFRSFIPIHLKIPYPCINLSLKYSFNAIIPNVYSILFFKIILRMKMHRLHQAIVVRTLHEHLTVYL